MIEPIMLTQRIKWFAGKCSTVIRRITLNALLAVCGFILSPLSWWNDLVVNIPLAYAFSYPFVCLSQQLFLPSFILGYWLTNIIGLILMHKGIQGMLKKEYRTGQDFKKNLAISLGYTLIMVVLVVSGVLKPPLEYLK